MFTPASLLSASCYTIELLPFHFLAYYPFRGHFRFPLWFVLLINGVNMSAQFLLCCYVAGTGGDIRSWDILTAVVSMAAYLFCVKAQVPKLLFIYTLVVDYVMIVRGIAVFLDIRFFTEPGHGYTLLGMPSGTIIRLIPFIITAPFMLTFLDITKRRVLGSHALQLWRTIWLIPALTSFIVLMFTWNLNIISVSGMAFLLARVSLLIMIFIVYHILVSSLESLKLQGEAKERARSQEQLIHLQRAQYSMLQK